MRALGSDTVEPHGLTGRVSTTPQTILSLERSQNGQTSDHILSESLEECRSILKRLYPAHDTQSLLLLSRQELIALLDLSDPQGLSSPSPTEFGSTPGFQSPIPPAHSNGPASISAFGDTPVGQEADPQYQVTHLGW